MENKIEEQERERRLKLLRAESRALRENMREKSRPTVWMNQKRGLIEIHFDNRTVLAEITNIDRETPRKVSDEMAEGSSMKQIIFQTKEAEN